MNKVILYISFLIFSNSLMAITDNITSDYKVRESKISIFLEIFVFK